MEEEIYAWAALLAIFIIPLASLVPRMLRKRRKNKKTQTISQEEEKFQTPSHDKYPKESKTMSSSKYSTKDMLVLGELIRGSKTFENIQKNTKFNNKELDGILEDLEKDEMLKVQQKKRLLGIKIELHPTDKGFKEYYS
ncbi:MAG: hypothetical protein OEM77_03025 [Nitrosopumilus sp.]|nr:hypothetical protein [Nitrosopumilus sp.]MDH3735834.1 hypothetical protein [Nitrosopumilus sp.]MDH3822435.1 hypothetical protein [Nitrosopumilus sp.]MDH3833126.1 hypothetical protein [Nitrosopumilus sp.]